MQGRAWFLTATLVTTGAACDDNPSAEPVDAAVDPCAQLAPPSAGDVEKSADGTFRIELKSTSPTVPAKFENDWGVRITDASGTPVEDATVEVTPWMPAHGHDGNFPPEIAAGDAAGTFEIDRINLWMGGLWEVRVDVEQGGVEERAVFDVCIED